MPYKQLSAILVVILPCISAPLNAQDAQSIDDIGSAICETLLPTPELELQQLAPDLIDAPGFSLVVEAVLRRCAAIGVLSLDVVFKGDPSRSHSGSDTPSDEEADRLAREARYYLETAMQIDPDASNDLLRRLLGTGPRPSD